MASPGSSATPPSPPLSALDANRPPSIGADLITTCASIDSNSTTTADDLDERQRAINRFTARAELGTLTRELRTRLLYAAYKANNQLTNATLPELEAKSNSYQQALAQAKAPSLPAKRKAGAAFVHYDVPGQMKTPISGGLNARVPNMGGSMGPPARPLVFENVTFGPTTNPTPPLPAAMIRSYYPDGVGGAAQTDGARSSLYAEMLAPPAKQARTIHNPESPFVSAPARTQAAPISRRGSRQSIDESRRSPRSGSSRPRAHSSTTGRSPGSRDKGKGREQPPAAEDDMRAAASLATLMQAMSRASVPGSPRSVASDVRKTPATAPIQLVPSTTNSPKFASMHVSTPPPTLPMSLAAVATTPKRTASHLSDSSITSATVDVPTDKEAADLLVLLAGSPSPRERARRGSESEFGLRSLSSDGLRAKGRVLFGGGADAATGTQHQARPIARTSTAPTSWDTNRLAPPPRAASFTGPSSGGLGVSTGAIARSPLVSEIVPTPVEEVPPAHYTSATLASLTPVTSGGLLPAAVPPTSHRSVPYALPTANRGAAGHSSVVTPSSTSGTSMSLAPAIPFDIGDFVHIPPSPGNVSSSRAQMSKEEAALHGRRLFETV